LSKKEPGAEKLSAPGDLPISLPLIFYGSYSLVPLFVQRNRRNMPCSNFPRKYICHPQGILLFRRRKLMTLNSTLSQRLTTVRKR
jgi:hypothetical protein